MTEQGETESEPRSPFDLIDADGSDSSQESSVEMCHSSREESDALSTPSASPNPLSSLPNVHRGAPSTWRRWTASERGLAASLDRLNAKDLAVHLFNAFALGKRAKNLKSRNEANAGVSEHAWSPPKSWTAWPLPPALVPTEDEGLQWESESYLNGPTISKKNNPREVLEDILIGHLQKVAKERFLKEHSRDASLNLPEVDFDEEEGLDLLEPVVMADDDLARDLTEPTVHHALAKLDGLLTALHHARYAYVATEGSASDSHDNMSGRKVQQKRKSARESRPKGSRSGKNKNSTSINPSPSQADSELSGSEQPSPSPSRNGEQSDSRNQKTKTPKRRKRYGLRDWSDIIGIAAMTGWEPKTVHRAAARCSSLFEEGMKFRTLEENGTPWEETTFPLSARRAEETKTNLEGISSAEQVCGNYEPVPAPAPIPKPRHVAGGDRDRDKEGSRYYCSVASCNRSSRGFWQARQLNRHLRQVHAHVHSELPAGGHLQGALYEREDEMVGGVHVDGFLQPVPIPGRWANASRRSRSRPRSRSRQGRKRVRSKIEN